MFKWFNSKNKNKVENHRVNDDLTRLGDIQAKQRLINQIQTLSGVTQDDFKSLYVMTIERFSDYLSEPNQSISLSSLLTVLNEVVLALKKRQGYLLPLGADSETSFREREEWTYAIFAGALLKSIDQQSRYAVAKAIIPKQAFAWLHRNTALFELWQTYLEGQSNLLSEIIRGQSVKPTIQPVLKETNGEDVSTAMPEAIKTIKKPELPKDAVIKEINLTDLGDTSNNAQAPPWIDESVIEKIEQPIETLVDLPEFTAQEFWEWLSQSLEAKTLSINKPESIVHRVDLGFLLVIPNIIETFIHEQTKQLGIHSHTAGLDQRIGLTKAIKKNYDLVRNIQGSRIHAYCLGKWEERKVLSGLVIKPEAILKKIPIEIPINPSLSIDPITVT